MVTRTARIPVLINRGGGTASSHGERLREEVEAAFAAVNVAIDLQLLDGEDIAAAASTLKDEALVVVGGGDGTLGCAVGALMEGDAALGILALGTRNHLARALGVPLDLPGAAKLVAERPIRAIDVGTVNGRVFVNNASVGLYPTLVRLRDAERERHEMPKWLAAIPASFAALKRIRHHRLRLAVPGSTREIVTPMLFVGNNRYILDAGRIGERAALDDGTLSVFAVAARRRRALIGFALRTLAGRAHPQEDFAAIGDVAELTVTGHSDDIDIAIDGEVVRLSMPLRFAIRVGALRVVAPLSEPTRSPKSQP